MADNLSHPTAVLHDKYSDKVETEVVTVGIISDTKRCSYVLSKLKKLCPLPQRLKHLKRMKTTTNETDTKVSEVIISIGDNIDHSKEILSTGGMSDMIRKCFVTSVPKKEPLTRQQFKETAKLWPTSFLEDKSITKWQDKTFFSLEEIREIHEHFNHINMVAQLGKAKDMVPVATTVVDPSSGQVLAAAYDCTKLGNPLHHACYVAIDMVAKKQGGGALRLCYKEHVTNGYSVCDCNFVNSKEGKCSSCQDEEAKDLLSAAKSELDPSYDKGKRDMTTTVLGNHKDEISNKRKRCHIKERPSLATPYLCTGYDLYTTHEPCLFCSMALLHSRVKRVFYIEPDPLLGGLGGRYKIHVQEGLNHHFQVFMK